MPDFLLTVSHAEGKIPPTPSSTPASASASPISSSPESLSTRRTARKPMITSSSHTLHQQNEEMTRLLRRSWVKYCMLYERNQASLTSLCASDEIANNSTDDYDDTQKIAKLDIRGLINSGDRLLDRLILRGLTNENANDEADDDSNAQSRASNSEDDDDEEQREMHSQVREVKARVRAKVQYDRVEDDTRFQRLDRIGKWLGVSLRR